MKNIGLIGGLSWESTQVYYSRINKLINSKLGGNHSARIYMYSFDFDEITNLQITGAHHQITDRLIHEIHALERAGADFFAICSNTLHQDLGHILAQVHIPAVSITTATSQAIAKSSIKTIGLLGTKYTMIGDFYPKAFADSNVQLLLPHEEDMNLVHKIIFDELTHGIINPDSRNILKRIIKKMEKQGAEGVALACTELPLIIERTDIDIRLFDTLEIHGRAIVEAALE